MSIGPLSSITDVAFQARKIDTNARSASANQVSGAAGEKNATDDSAANGRGEWQSPESHQGAQPADADVPSDGAHPATGETLDITG